MPIRTLSSKSPSYSGKSAFSSARKGLLTFLELVRAADGIDGLLEIHQRHRVIRMLKIRIHIIRRSTGETFDVRKIHDGFVKLQYHRREQRNNPTIVIAGITAR